MTQMPSIAVIGDYDPENRTHVATTDCFDHVAIGAGLPAEVSWLSTSDVLQLSSSSLSDFDGFLIAPGSPYTSMQGALSVIEFARVHGIPLLGTCGGCQHVIIEFARNVLGISDAAHAEYDPYASNLFIKPLSCSLVGLRLPISIKAGSTAEAIYRQAGAEEEYYCNFGLNPDYQDQLDAAGLRTVAEDDNGEARVFSLDGHPFLVATLFLPQLRSTAAEPHPILRAFIEAAARAALERDVSIKNQGHG